MLFILCSFICCCVLNIIVLMKFRENLKGLQNLNHRLQDLNHLLEGLNHMQGTTHLLEGLDHIQGATQESINALPIYKFQLNRPRTNSNRESSEIDLDSRDADGGGTIGVGTNKEHMISAEDAVCCICLAKYADNDKLRRLTCTHLFHKECVDKWLKISALCPLCKAEVPNSSTGLLDLNLGQRYIDHHISNDRDLSLRCNKEVT